MDKKLFKYELIGFIFVNIFGTLCHFIYDWSGQSIVAAFFCPVNESVWEHMKLLYFPFLVYSGFEMFKIVNDEIANSFLIGKLIGIELGMYTTLSVHYIYNGATGQESMAIDILSFVIGVLVAFFISYIFINNKLCNKVNRLVSTILLALQGVIMIVFTFYPPYLPLFMDSQTMTYGI